MGSRVVGWDTPKLIWEHWAEKGYNTLLKPQGVPIDVKPMDKDDQNVGLDQRASDVVGLQDGAAEEPQQDDAGHGGQRSNEDDTIEYMWADNHCIAKGKLVGNQFMPVHLRVVEGQYIFSLAALRSLLDPLYASCVGNAGQTANARNFVRMSDVTVAKFPYLGMDG
eukprot:jgi/Tetstr1/444214/TSEL_032107.t1